MTIAAGWTYLWTQGLTALWSTKPSDSGRHSATDSSTFDTVFFWFFKFMWSAGACMAIGIGISGCLVVFANFVRVVIPCVKSLVGYLKQRFWPGNPEESDDTRVGLFERASSIVPPPPNAPLIRGISGRRQCFTSHNVCPVSDQFCSSVGFMASGLYRCSCDWNAFLRRMVCDVGLRSESSVERWLCR